MTPEHYTYPTILPQHTGNWFFKEQIERLEIAMSEANVQKHEPGHLRGFSKGTEAILTALENAEEPLFPREIAKLTGLKTEYCSRQLSKFLEKPDTYGVKAVRKGNQRGYMVI